MNRARAVAAAVLLFAVATLAGCGHRSGRVAGPGQKYNLEVDNGNPNHSLVVFVDDGEIGRLRSEEIKRFYVQPGLRKVELRFDWTSSTGPLIEHHVFSDDGTVVRMYHDR